MRAIINVFNAGELSPSLDARVDVDKYKNGCRILENAIPKIQGGAYGRAGMGYIGARKYDDKTTRLIPFQFNVTTTFVLEFGDGYIRFWSNGLQVEVMGSPYEIASPYAEADVFNIQFTQVNDVMYLVDGTHPVQKLTRLADTNWTIAEVAWKYPTVQDQNITTTTLACSATTGTGKTLTASAALFDAGMVGGYFQLIHYPGESAINLYLNESGESGDIRIIGAWNFTTYGDWQGEVYVERKNASGGYDVVRSCLSSDNNNIVATGKAEEETSYRIRMVNSGSVGGAIGQAILQATDSRVFGVVKVTAVTDSTHAMVDVVNDIQNTTATTYWNEGAWSTFRGQPRTVALFQQRLIFGGCEHQPLTVWGSTIGDFENFQMSASLVDSSYAFTIGSIRGNSIVWLAARQDLMIGTQGEEYLMAGASSTPTSASTPVTGNSVNIQQQTAYGGAYIQPVMANDTVMFVQRGRKLLREFVYDFTRNQYTGTNLNLLAEHMFAGTQLQQLDFASNPDPVVWAVSQDGRLFSMTFERDQNVVGWSRHPTDGQVESVAVIYGQNGQADEVWLATVRTVDGGTKRYIERLDPEKWLKLDAGDIPHMIYLDCAKVVTLGSPGTAVTGLDHLEGRSVSILADGFAHPNRTVVGGAITLQANATVVVAGLPFIVRVQPTKIDVQLQDGSSQGRIWKCGQAMFRFWKTIGAQYADAPDKTFYDISFRDVSTPLDVPGPLYDGDHKVFLASSYRKSMDITIQQTKPLPFHLEAISPVVNILGS